MTYFQFDRNFNWFETSLSIAKENFEAKMAINAMLTKYHKTKNNFNFQ